ncbi:hypothetical protein CDN99_21500 [Roseateles aquatilis]|uniref:Transglutaminase-like domain-containing protein n=1 Tax=Roseateles aquatilis TaxID=431061 RepID=A0A246IZ73_9BURK|nr:transglutaminase family protein [Roseateles aquatilis]OWQ85660.1 hypothetical protein CDN99_21500 [Roseateles aquatilis]
MIRLDLHVELDYQIEAPHGDFLFNIQPARTAAQTVSDERLSFVPAVPWRSETVPGTTNRLIRVQAPPGTLHLTYSATVTIRHFSADPATVRETPLHELPIDVLPYLMPSRYCESDRLGNLASAEFGALPLGHERVRAVMAWVRRNLTYAANSSTSRTTAVETLTERSGVCRDFAHVMIALCRALSLPARFVTGTDYGADPSKAADFHAYVEVYLDGRWYLFDPSATGIPQGFLRIGTGRDAADVPFAMMFGQVVSHYAPLVRAVAVAGPGLELPTLSDLALSTDAGSDAAVPGIAWAATTTDATGVMNAASAASATNAMSTPNGLRAMNAGGPEIAWSASSPSLAVTTAGASSAADAGTPGVDPYRAVDASRTPSAFSA